MDSYIVVINPKSNNSMATIYSKVTVEAPWELTISFSMFCSFS